MNDAPPPLHPSSPQPYAQGYSQPYPQPHPQYPAYPPPRRSGCCGLPGVGCGLGCLLLAGVAVALMVFAGFAAKNWVDTQLVELTSTQEVSVAEPQASPAAITTAIDKFDTFRRGMEGGHTPEPLVLTGEELNLLLWHHPESKLAGKTRVSIDDDVLEAEVALSFDDLPLPEGYFKEKLKGRYFHGTAGLRGGITAGRPVLYLESLSMNGVAIPEMFLTEIRNQNLLEEAAKDPDFQRTMEKIEELRIEDGRLYILPKAAP